MPVKTPLMERLDLSAPIIQAPMAGSDTPELAIAVSEAGGLGSMGMTYLAPDDMKGRLKTVRSRTNRVVNVNLFAPQPIPPLPGDTSEAVERLRPFYEDLGVGLPAVSPGADKFADRFPLVLEGGVKVFSFIMGLIPEDAMRALRARDTFIIGTATNVPEAKQLEAAGVDAIVAQGSEAGGHRGSFTPDYAGSMVGSLALIPQVADAVSVPVIAAGGISDGRGVAAALILGAEAVQIGTAFLTTDESGAPEAHKRAVLQVGAHESRVTHAFSGRPARGVVNSMMEAVEDFKRPRAVLPFPHQNALTRPLRAAAAKAGKADCLALWAGQAGSLSRREKAADTVKRLMAETDAALKRF